MRRNSFLNLTLVFVLLWSASSFAAYRVYKLRIENFDAAGRSVANQVVLTTLDIWQYEHYYGGYRWMTLKLVDTWYCPGDTSHKRYCDKPRVKDRAPSSNSSGQRVTLPYNLQPIIP